MPSTGSTKRTEGSRSWTSSSTRASSSSPGSASRCRPAGSADTVDEAVTQAERAGYPVVVKAQVQVGGRGKAGGIKLAATADEVRAARREHPRDGHQGPRREARLGRARVRHRRGVLRELHARPLGEEVPEHGVGARRRRHRAGRRGGTRRDREDLHRSGRRPQRRTGPRHRRRGQARRRRRSTARPTSSRSSTAATSRATAISPRSTR